MQYLAEVEPIVLGRAMLIFLLFFFLQVHTIVYSAEVWWTATATTVELSSSDRGTSFRDHQIMLTNWLFCPKSYPFYAYIKHWQVESPTHTSFLLLQQHDLYFCTVCALGVSSTYFVFIFQVWISLQDVCQSLQYHKHVVSQGALFTCVKHGEERHPTSEVVNFRAFYSLWCPS